MRAADIIHSASSRTKNAMGATLVGMTRRPRVAPFLERGRMRREPAPADRAGEAELIETSAGRIIGDAARAEFGASQALAGRLETLQLANDFERAAFAEKLRAGRDVLPAQQPAHELRGRDGLDLAAQIRRR